MRHRHLNHSRFTLAAIDDIIARPQWRDWDRVKSACGRVAIAIFDRVCEVE